MIDQAASARTNGLDAGCFVVIGEGLAAGAGSFALTEDSQITSFPVQAARQMRTSLVVPYLQAPGIPGAPGFPTQPVIVPNVMQTRVVDAFPLRRRHQHLAIPGYEVSDCVRRRPVPPLIHRHDARQTIANLVLGLPALTTDPSARRATQLEYAVDCGPTLALVVLGYAEALRALFSGDVSCVPPPAAWARDYEHVARSLAETGAALVLATIPDPADTPACSSLDAAAQLLRVDPADIARRYALDDGDCLTVYGLVKIGGDVLAGGTSLDNRDVIRGGVRTAVSEYVARLNQIVARVAAQSGAAVLALDALVRRVRDVAIDAGGRALTHDLFGGFYTLNGCFPGAAGHAMIANELLRVLDAAHGTAFSAIDIGDVARTDPMRQSAGPGQGRRLWSPPRPVRTASRGEPARPRPVRAGSAGLPLRLPRSLEMTLPLCRNTSYHGDAIRVVNCTDPRDMQFGSCADVLFGGPVLFDSHLSGTVRIRFSPPNGDLARFELEFDPFVAEDGVLSAPMFFRWPVIQATVFMEPGTIASGTVDLRTGESHDVTLSVRYVNSALAALVAVNPGFPDVPITFPGQYGSAWALFEQRDDETLDFTFYGSTFLPLGAELGGRTVVWALPFAGADGQFASIPSRGLAMHPHLHLCTREVADTEAMLDPGERGGPIELPQNTVCEMTLFTRRSSFGDRFTLNTPELGGPATGRSHLLGRLLLQTGEPADNLLPIAVSLVGPGGMLGQTPPPPLATLFPGRLSPGPVGHDEHLRFPTRNYYLDGVTLVDDPFDLSIGAVDLRSGRLINQLLHRGFIGQDLFFSLIRVEPRTPRSSFLFRGPAAIERGVDGTTVFRLRAVVRVPYPAGFLFPAPDYTTAITVGDDSVLDPYLWLRAATDMAATQTLSLTRTGVRSSTGEDFSYRLDVRAGEETSVSFEYANDSQRARFRMRALSWIGQSRVRIAHGRDVDVVTFSGFGMWSKDPTGRAHQVSAQIAVGAEEYVSIQIDGGLVSNVNTKPAEEAAAMP